MADPRRRRPQNVAGPWFVDDTCIDCGTCMWMAPKTFAEDDGMSAVHQQPPGAAGAGLEGDPRAVLDAASAALAACPTGSIGGPASKVAWPRPVEGAPGVWHLGFHDRSSFGAASWLVRTDAGNVMIDVPRFAGPIVRAVEAAGGVAAIVLTHRDDVGAHEQWHDRFGAERAIHVDDDRIGAEIRLGADGETDGTIAGLAWTHVPGHTKGHVVFQQGSVLFTGDHLAGSTRDPTRLRAFRSACWYDWGKQTRSMEGLADRDVQHVLPGHGAPWHGTVAQYQTAMRSLIDWMHTV